MGNIINFDKNFGKEKCRDDLNFDDVVLFDNDQKELSNEERTKYLQLLHDCVEPSELEFESDELPTLLFAFEYETVMEFLKKCENKPCVTSYTANAGKELFDGLQNVHSYHILSIIEGNGDSKLDDIFCFDKPFVDDMSIAMKINNDIKDNFKVTVFYAPIKK